MVDPAIGNLRQMIYWKLLSAVSGLGETGAALETMAAKLAAQLELPSEILDPTIGVDVLLHRYPRLVPHFEAVQRCMQPREDDATDPSSAGSPIKATTPDENVATSVAPSRSRSCCSMSSDQTRARHRARRPSTASGARTLPPSSAAWG